MVLFDEAGAGDDVRVLNGVNDLLAINVEVQDRLPADSRAFGFDNIGSALSLSSAQLEAYLEAADAVLDAAIVSRPKPVVMKKRTNGLEALGEPHTRLNGGVLELEEAAVGFGKFFFYGSRDTTTPEEGLYRVRASMYGYQTQGQTLTVYVRSTHKTGDRTIGYFEVPPDSPHVIEPPDHHQGSVKSR